MPTVLEINPVVVVWSMNFFAKPNECCKLRKMFGYRKMKPMNLDSTWQMEERTFFWFLRLICQAWIMRHSVDPRNSIEMKSYSLYKLSTEDWVGSKAQGKVVK